MIITLVGMALCFTECLGRGILLLRMEGDDVDEEEVDDDDDISSHMSSAS